MKFVNFLIILSIFLLIFTISNDKDINSSVLISEEINFNDIKDTYKDCNKSNMDDFIDCTINNVNKFYKYRVNDDDNILPFAELMENGGDCLDWAKLYKEIGEENGYYAEIVVIDVSIYTAHAFVVYSSNEMYCIIDQMTYNCIKFN